jgi:protein gp37
VNTTKIDWCDRVWNPVTGCTKVSAGCKNCYAEGIANRFWGERKFTDVRCHEERLDQPMKLRKPSKIFVNSMSDLFHEDVPFDFVAKVWDVMAVNPQHTFMILTKRVSRLRFFILRYILDHIDPLPNVWIGVSVEDQQSADDRIHDLLGTPAAVRFVSIEPLLESVTLREINGALYSWGRNYSVEWVDKGKLDWVIAGAETGVKARICHTDWLRSIRDECLEAEIPFFLKQTGKNHNKILDEQEWHEFPEVNK